MGKFTLFSKKQLLFLLILISFSATSIYGQACVPDPTANCADPVTVTNIGVDDTEVTIVAGNGNVCSGKPNATFYVTELPSNTCQFITLDAGTYEDVKFNIDPSTTSVIVTFCKFDNTGFPNICDVTVAPPETEVNCGTPVDLDACSTEAEIISAYNTWVSGFEYMGDCTGVSDNIASIPTLPTFVEGAAVSLNFTYEVMSTDTTCIIEPMSCSSTFNVAANPLDEPTVAVVDATCEMAGSASVSNFDTALTYTVSPSGTVDGSGNITGLTPGTDYTVTAENASGCTADSAVFSIGATLDAVDEPTVAVVDATCEMAGSASVSNFDTALTYTVSPSGTVDGSGNITGLTPGTDYTVTAENASGCTADSAVFSIGATLDAVDEPTVAVVDATCEMAGSASVSNFDTALTYTVSPSGTVDGSGNITGLTPGTDYTVTAENASGCTADSAVFSIGATLDAVDEPTVAVVDATCEMAGSASVSNFDTALTYTVSPSGTVDGSGNITGLTPGTDYTVTAENASGCTADSAVFSIGATLDAVDEPTVAVVDATCEMAGSASVSNFDTALTYTVSPSGTVDGSGNITGLTPGTDYTVTAENASGCTADSAVFSIGATLDAVDEPTVAVVDATCEMAGSASVSNFDTALTYTVSPSGTVDGSGNITGLTPGTDYTVTAENASGCTADSAVFMIEEQLEAPDDVFDTATVCADESYTWNRDGNEYTFEDSPIIITLEGDNGCSYTATLTLTEDETPDAGADNSTAVCEGSTVDLSALVTQVGGMFSTTNGGTINGNEFDTTGLPPGAYIVEYTVSGDGVCPDDKALITISVAEDVIVQTCEAVDATFCGDGTTKYNFYWFGSDASAGGSNFFGSDAMNNLSFTEFNDGTALVQGTTILGSCTAELYIKLVGKTDWAGWQLQDGTFKNMGCTNPNPEALHYYVIDNTVSRITTTGGDCLEEGTFIVSQKPDPNDPLTPHLGVIVGPGGVLHGLNPSANGIAGWGFMGPENNPKKYEIDFNFELDCKDATGCDFDKEICDGIDNDGDGLIDEGFDSDNDGTPDCADDEECDGLDNDGDLLVDEGFDSDMDGIADCFDEEVCDGKDNDGDGEVDEGLTCGVIELCDGIDNDGDGEIDEGFEDTDNDGIADCVDQCDNRFDSDNDGTPDCEDVEECDGLDNDGDGIVDEGFADTDGDGTADCQDMEVCDGVDNDGDGDIDEGFDSDNDGIADCVDVEECDGIDNDGDGEIDEGLDCEEVCDGVDNDGDGEIDEGLDCEEVCDGVDNDGDGEIDEGLDCEEVCDGIDNDGDGEIDEGLDCTDCIDFVVTTESVTNEKCPGDGKGKIRLGVTGGKPNYTFSWSHDSDEKSRNPVQLSEGTYTVTVTDSNGCIVEHTVEVGLDSDSCKSGKKVTSTTVKAFPMTFKNELNLSIDIPYDTKLKVEMFDVNGRCVMEKNGMNLKTGSNEVRLNLSSMAPDVYFLILNTGREKIVKKVMSRK